jgi:hypothetical protein
MKKNYKRHGAPLRAPRRFLPLFARAYKKFEQGAQTTDCLALYCVAIQ